MVPNIGLDNKAHTLSSPKREARIYAKHIGKHKILNMHRPKIQHRTQ